MFELMVEDSFHAAHALKGYEGPCENLHGHTFKVQVFFQGKQLDNIGLLKDFKILKKEVSDILAEFDHKLLNDLGDFKTDNPSSENLAKIIYAEIKKRIGSASKVAVWESPEACASYWE